MSDPSGRATITLNGEIYNYVELHETLQAHGHRFRGTGDTEVLLHAYLEWGPEVLERLSGMFAFGLYDAERQELFAARDPMGQKPFFYYVDDDGLVFASELGALLRHPRVPRSLNADAIAAYLVYEHLPAPLTPLQRVQKLAPGHALLYSPQRRTLRVWRYWDSIGPAPLQTTWAPSRDDEDALIEQLRAATQRHLRSDVPVGVYLSGGVDSVTLAVLACDTMGPRNLQTFTVAQEEPSFDESAQARRVARQLGTRHHELPLSTAQAVETVPELVQQLDEPLADPGYVAMAHIASLASRHVKVVLSGDGGDELLYGYEPFKLWKVSERLAHSSPALRRSVRWLIERTPAQYGYMGLWQRARHFSRGINAPSFARNTLWLSAFTPEEACELLIGADALETFCRHDDGWPHLYDDVRVIHQRTQGYDALARLGAEYQMTYLPNTICPHTDKANMRFSLEARSPFLDPAVVRYINALPSAWKLHGWQSKWILRRWLARRLGWALPVKKRGFTVPVALWLRRELRSFAWTYLQPERIKAVGLFHPVVVTRLWESHQVGRANHAKKLWTLLLFQVWADQYLLGTKGSGRAVGCEQSQTSDVQPVHARDPVSVPQSHAEPG